MYFDRFDRIDIDAPLPTVDEIVRKLRVVFDSVEIDPDAGWDHVDRQIKEVMAYRRIVKRRPKDAEKLDDLTHHIGRLRELRSRIACVRYRDTHMPGAGTVYLYPGYNLFFRPQDETDASRSAVEIAAAALGHERFPDG